MASLAFCTCLVLALATHAAANIPRDENSAKLVSLLKQHASLTTDTVTIDTEEQFEKNDGYYTHPLIITRTTLTQVTTETVTTTVVPTCTQTMEGVLPCPTYSVEPQQILETEPVSTTSTASYDVVEAVLPSCSCGSHREGRQKDDNETKPPFTVVVTHITDITETNTITRVHPEATASIIYAGCVPYDVVVTTPCVSI